MLAVMLSDTPELAKIFLCLVENAGIAILAVPPWVVEGSTESWDAVAHDPGGNSATTAGARATPLDLHPSGTTEC
jgi:hypothetical protein